MRIGGARTVAALGVVAAVCFATGAWLFGKRNQPVQVGGPAGSSEIGCKPIGVGAPPSSSKIVFSKQLNIYSMNLDGSGLTRLTSLPGANYHPIFSPDGSKILFTSGRDGYHHMEIYVMNADGSDQRRLTYNNESHKSNLSISPDGHKILYQFAEASDGPLATRMIDACGKSSPPPGNLPGPFAFSADGKKLISGYGTDIFVANADGTNPTRFKRNGSDPSFSPDGRRIVFVSRHNVPKLNPSDAQPSIADGIAVINVDGTGYRKLNDLPASSPKFTRDGQRIVFSGSSSRGTDNDIYIMNVDGSGLQNLTNTPQQHDEDPDVR
jgi:Tol biopolymer transport system component